MKILLCLDPGIRLSGAALFYGQELVIATCIRTPYLNSTDNTAAACAAMARQVCAWTAHMITKKELFSNFAESGHPAEIVCEWPQIYQRTENKTKGDPNDMIPLAGIDAALAALEPGAIVTSVLPATWKAQIPKEIMGKRILARLSESERKRIEDHGTKTHNAIDAVGLGLYHLGRLERQRVIHR